MHSEVQLAAFRNYVSPFEDADRLSCPSDELRHWTEWRADYTQAGDPERREHCMEAMLRFVTAENPPPWHEHRTPTGVKAFRWGLLGCLAAGLTLLPVGPVCTVFFIFAGILTLISAITFGACSHAGCRANL